MKNSRLLITICSLSFLIVGQSDFSEVAAQKADPDAQLFESLKFRSIGPFRGGRSAACTGVRGNPMLYYMGAAGGGVWKTDDAGSTWKNISDGFFGGSIGAIAVAPSDPNILYVGGGEVSVRGNVSHGYGMWKSYDAGKTWTNIGLNDSRRIPRIRIDPHDPNIVYAAVLGHLFGPNQERGVYKSTDGGQNWKRVLFANEDAGAVDLAIDPNNPRVLYASTWRVLRTPYSLESGGEGSGLWKSVDAGETWSEITRAKGLPKKMVGIIGMAISPVDSNRVWAQIEAADGGLFRSDNAGESWTKVNDERKLRQRAWYYTRVYAGTKNIDEVYVLNVSFWRSGDGGKTFSGIRTPHGDHHDLWIDPDDPNRMAIADDGGVQISFSRGDTWSTYQNQPTSQFYRVTTDDHFPYRIYGAQQDNSTVRIKHRTRGGSIGERDWESTAGGESGHIAPDPNDPEIVYGGSYGGLLTRVNHRTKEYRNVHVWPDNPMGHGAGDGKYRFQWNFPLFFSRHDSKTLFTAANVLFKTTDEGQTWEQISPDLTRNDKSKLGSSGGPITQDNTGVEYYCTIFATAESIHDDQTIWCGSDDGLLHVTQDGGENWKNVTPPEMPEWMQINSIEPHPTEAGGLYVAGTRYKLDDFKPYLYRTLDYGKTWTRINNGIDNKHFTRVIRADAKRAGLLYAGTESGLYVSFDDGKNWKPFQCNLPIVPITDLALKNDDLIVATQGRSFWVLDDLTTLHQWDKNVQSKDWHLFAARPAYRMGGSSRSSNRAGTNVASQVNLRFLAKEKLGENQVAKISIEDAAGSVAAVFSTKPDKQKKESSFEWKAGMNSVSWNMRYPGAESFDGLVLWGGGTQGPMAVPGEYTATLSIGQKEVKDEAEDSAESDSTEESDQPAEQVETNSDSADERESESASITFEILKDPRASATEDDLQAQFDFLIEVRDKLTETHESIKKLRDVRGQIKSLTKRLGKQDEYKDLIKQGDEIAKSLTTLEERLYQTNNRAPQDPLNFPIKLNNRLSALVSVVSSGDNRPTEQAYKVRDELVELIDKELSQLNDAIADGISQFNEAVREAEVPAVFVDNE